MSRTNEPPPWVTAPTPISVNPASAPYPGDAIHTLQGYIHHETEKAILFEVWQVDGKEIDLAQSQRKMWFPLSQVKSVTTARNPDADEVPEYDNIRCKEWILGQKGLI